MQLVARKAGRIGRDRIPFHPLDDALPDIPPLFDGKRRMLGRSLDPLDGNPDTRSFRQFDWGFGPKSAMFKNSVQQFHHLLSIAPCLPASKRRRRVGC
jgi:hypothetical protein